MFWFVLAKRSFQLMNPQAMKLSDWNKVQGKYVSPNSLLTVTIYFRMISEKFDGVRAYLTKHANNKLLFSFNFSFSFSFSLLFLCFFFSFSFLFLYFFFSFSFLFLFLFFFFSSFLFFLFFCFFFVVHCYMTFFIDK
jgi:hypothetical protein